MNRRELIRKAVGVTALTAAGSSATSGPVATAPKALPDPPQVETWRWYWTEFTHDNINGLRIGRSGEGTWK